MRIPPPDFYALPFFSICFCRICTIYFNVSSIGKSSPSSSLPPGGSLNESEPLPVELMVELMVKDLFCQKKDVFSLSWMLCKIFNTGFL